MIDRRIISALLPTRCEVAFLFAACVGVALVPVSEWLWVKLVLPRLF